MESNGCSPTSPMSSADLDTESHFYQDLVNGKPPLITKSPSLHKMKAEGNFSKVLVIYTGGTIGMMRTENGGMKLFLYFPVFLCYVHNHLVLKKYDKGKHLLIVSDFLKISFLSM